MAIDLGNQLREVRRAILSMGASVEQRVNHAIDAVFEADLRAASAVRHGDGEIDRMEVDLERECLRILALSQPVACDLRFVLAVMRTNSDLERIGDLARSIAKRAIDLHSMAPIRLPEALHPMATETQRMLSGALQSIADHEAGQARRVREADQRVDDLLKEVFAWAQEEIPRHVEWTAGAINVLSIARKLERIADMSTNIAEEVIFLIEGRLVRHTAI